MTVWLPLLEAGGVSKHRLGWSSRSSHNRWLLGISIPSWAILRVSHRRGTRNALLPRFPLSLTLRPHSTASHPRHFSQPIFVTTSLQVHGRPERQFGNQEDDIGLALDNSHVWMEYLQVDFLGSPRCPCNPGNDDESRPRGGVPLETHARVTAVVP